jgi:hypothetical protein
MHDLRNLGGSCASYVPFRFDEIDRVPDSRGIYAWYHRITIPDTDVRAVEAKLGALDQSETTARAQIIRDFLASHVFGPLRETPYNVAIRGPLKPNYEGKLSYQPPEANDLVNKLAATPTSLSALVAVLRNSVPFFSSPIYIGVARRSLRTRLGQHAKLLSQLRESRSRSGHPDTPVSEMRFADEESARDHSFAYDAIVHRGLSPLDLLVYILEIDFAPDIALAAEHLLNRINYPLCGRN